jgi:hypothetical protein
LTKSILAGCLFAAVVAVQAVSVSARHAEQVSQSTADAWPAKWCQAQPGITREALTAIMGAPTGTSPTTMSWSAHQYQFNAFFDAAGSVRQLDINTYALSAAEQAALKCAKVRTRASVARAAAAASAKPARPHASGCGLITATEMSDILGVPMVAQPRPGDVTECYYKPATGVAPAVKLTVDWGDGKVAMASAGMMERREPGLTSPYEGIGDQAAAVGPALMIRTGEDLMTIVFTGVKDAPSKAKRIFTAAKARM